VGLYGTSENHTNQNRRLAPSSRVLQDVGFFFLITIRSVKHSWHNNPYWGFPPPRAPVPPERSGPRRARRLRSKVLLIGRRTPFGKRWLSAPELFLLHRRISSPWVVGPLQVISAAFGCRNRRRCGGGRFSKSRAGAATSSGLFEPPTKLSIRFRDLHWARHPFKRSFRGSDHSTADLQIKSSDRNGRAVPSTKLPNHGHRAHSKIAI